MMGSFALVGTLMYTYLNSPHKFNFDYNWDDGIQETKDYDPINEVTSPSYLKVIKGFLKTICTMMFSKKMLFIVP